MNPTYLLAAVDVVAVLVLAMAVYHPRHRRADLVTLGLIGGLGTSDLVLSISLMAGLVVVLAVADSRLLHSTGLRQVVVLDSAITGEPTLVERLELLLEARVTRVTPVRVDLVNDTTTVEVHYAAAPRPVLPRAERHDAPALTR